MAKRISDQDYFNFFVPLSFEKGVDGDSKHLMKIKGVASSMTEDSDGETLDPSGFDFGPLLKSGMINWNHNASKTSAAICGKPTGAKITNKGRDLELEGVIFNNTEGRAVAELLEVLDGEPDRQIGWSIEGYKTNTDFLNPKKITGAVINGVALTHVPKNKNTFVSIVKGEYSEAYQEDEEEEEKEVDKAVTTDTIAAATPESVDHDPKKVTNNNSTKEFGKLLKKSDIYIAINNKYPTATIAEVKNIFSKFFSMSVADKVTPELLQKSFLLIDEALALVKSKEAAPVIVAAEGTLQKSEDDDDVEKAMSTAAFLVKAGYTKETACDTMVKGGIALTVAQGAVDSVIASANAKKQGGEVTALSKAQIDQLGKKVEDDIKKSIDPVVLQVSGVKDAIAKGFEGFNNLLKGLQEENAALVTGNKAFSDRLEVLEKTPGVKKSITVAGAIEKFEKGQEANRIEGMEYINVNSKDDLKKLVNILDAANDVIIQKGGSGDALLEKAIESIEIGYEVPQAAYARLRAMNIILQK